jgi:hypothetical protein
MAKKAITRKTLTEAPGAGAKVVRHKTSNDLVPTTKSDFMGNGSMNKKAIPRKKTTVTRAIGTNIKGAGGGIGVSKKKFDY